MPTVLPQKRPGEKSRVFVHAYAPVLHDLGIDERSWMDFLSSFEEAIWVSQVDEEGARVLTGAGQLLGLFCLVMLHDPQSQNASQTFDLSKSLSETSV